MKKSKMKKLMTISFNDVDAMQIIESLDNERDRRAKILSNTTDENIAFDYRNDIVYIDELIIRFRKAALEAFGTNVVEYAHFPRGTSL